MHRFAGANTSEMLAKKPLREVVWVILDHFRTAVFFCCCRCGHVGNALALSIMSTAMPVTMRTQRCSGNEALARRGVESDCWRG
jgi:D-arabinose 5-phosphate isomerase GutQ